MANNTLDSTSVFLYIGMLFLFTAARSTLVYSIVIAKHINQRLWKAGAITLAVETIVEITFQGVASWVPGYMLFATGVHILGTTYFTWLNCRTVIPRRRLREESNVAAKVKPAEEAKKNEKKKPTSDPLNVPKENNDDEVESELQGQFIVDTEMIIPESKSVRFQ